LVEPYSIKMVNLHHFPNVQDLVTFSFLSKKRRNMRIMKETVNILNFVFLFLKVICNVNNKKNMLYVLFCVDLRGRTFIFMPGP
jgi:hypothetical protein